MAAVEADVRPNGSLARPSDQALDARSNLCVSSLSGVMVSCVAGTIGYVFRVTLTGVSTAAPVFARAIPRGGGYAERLRGISAAQQ